MIIGVPKEIKIKETRVALVPHTVQKLTQAGHTVLVEKNAGLLYGFSNDAYEKAGAKLIDGAGGVWAESNLIMKVKEPMESEFGYFRADLNLFTYLHLASAPAVAEALCKSKMTSIAYETVETADGQVPLLAPMSEVAGRLGTQVGTSLLHRTNGGKGLLLGGVTGTKRGVVLVIGGGSAGLNAAEVAAGLRAETIILEIRDEKIAWINEHYKGAIKAVKSTPASVNEWVQKADLLVGAVYVTGDRAPHLVSRHQVASMEAGSVIVDIAIDQGGCIETSRPTTHEHPTYIEEGVIHYCVTNMPALTPRTSTEALTSATEAYVLEIANKGVDAALAANAVLAKGLNTKNGKVCQPVLQKLFPHLA